MWGNAIIIFVSLSCRKWIRLDWWNGASMLLKRSFGKIGWELLIIMIIFLKVVVVIIGKIPIRFLVGML